MTITTTAAATTPYGGSDFPKAKIADDAPPAARTLIAAAAERRERTRPAPADVVALADALATPGVLQTRQDDRDAANVALARGLLSRIAALGEDSDILAEHTISEFPVEVARAAERGHTLSFLGERIGALLDAAELDATAAPRPDGGWLIGMARFDAGSAERSLGDYAGWSQSVEWDAQTAEVIWDPRSGQVSVSLTARSVSRRTHAAFGGNPVSGTFRDDRKVEPYTDTRRTYDYEAAKAITVVGALFGGRVILARGVRLGVSRYSFTGADPRSQSWEISVEGREATR